MRDITGRQLFWITALGLVSTVLPFIAILKAFELTTAARAALVGYLVPMIAAVMSIAALGEPVTTSFVLGAVLIITGVVVADRSDRRIPVTPPL